MNLLVWSIVPLFIGPFLYEWAKQRRYLLSVLDGFIFVAISSLLFLHFAEGLESDSSMLALGFLLLGFLGPNYLEKRLEKGAATVHLLSIIVGVSGLIVHATLDGAGLVVGTDSALPLAIILHRIPVGLMLWWLLAPVVKRPVLLGIFALMVLATIGGWAGGVQLLEGVSPLVRVSIESFVAGSIFHVVFFQVHLATEGKPSEHHCCAHHQEHAKEPAQSGLAVPHAIGNLLAIAFIVALVRSEPDHLPGLEEPLHVFLDLALQTAPALVAAYFLAGLLYAFVPSASYRWMSKGSRPTQALKGVLFGLPLPICSCGVLPFYRSLIDKGVAKTAAIAFLIATPELGLDAVLISIPLLGSTFTGWRLIAAFAVAFTVALLLGKGGSKKSLQVIEDKPVQSLAERLKMGWRYGFCDLVDSTGPWILLGLLVAALLQPVLEGLPLSFPYQLDVVIFSTVGIFVYVCASGATPLVAILLSAGLSPGAALAFLLTGPATNVSTFGVLSALHGKSFALAFGFLVTMIACLLGILVNLTVGNGFISEALRSHAHGVSAVNEVCLLIATLIFIGALVRRGARRFCSEIFGGEVLGDVETC